jgi:hypothetical protein
VGEALRASRYRARSLLVDVKVLSPRVDGNAAFAADGAGSLLIYWVSTEMLLRIVPREVVLGPVMQR